MNTSLLQKEILPFLLSFGLLILLTVLIDYLLHQAGLVGVGRWLGIPGTVLILASFLYTLRKRKVLRSGRPRTFLRLHEVLAWLGALLVLIHAGVHVYTALPWLAVAAMLVNIISGMTGTYLLDRSRRYLAARREYQSQRGVSPEVTARALFWDATSYELMRRWRTVHLPITLAFGVLATAHIVSILFFWGWK